MKILTVLLVCVIVLGITQYVNAETFILEATSKQDRNDYLYIEFFLDRNIIETKNAFLKHDNYLIIFDGTPAKFYKSGGFSMKNRDIGIAIYGHPVNTLQDLEYNLIVLIQGENGKEVLRFYSHGIPQEKPKPIIEEIKRDPLAEYKEAQKITGLGLVSELERIAEEKRIASLPVKEKQQYIPELLITSSHDFRTYWQDTFNIDVQTFDGNINSDPKSSSDFHGRIDGVDVKVLLSYDGEHIATLSGITNNGNWDGEYFFKENISTPGEYIVDVITSYLGETVSKSSSMFVIGTTTKSDYSNHQPIAFAGYDKEYFEYEELDKEEEPTFTIITLNGTKSSDPDDDELTFLWINKTNFDIILNSTFPQKPTFTAPDIEEITELIFELTVTDLRGLFDVDSVTITINPVIEEELQ